MRTSPQRIALGKGVVVERGEGHGPSVSIRNRIAQVLGAAIVSGELKAGEIYSAPVLATRFNVSATPVREAMIDLAKDGLVDVIRNKGFRVLAPSPADLHNILELRLLIEVPTVERIAERGVRPAELATLFPVADETVRAAEAADVLAHVTADLRFHLGVMELWGNVDITETVRVLRTRSRLFGLWSEDNRSLMVESSREHLELLELIRDRQPQAARELMSSHISRVAALWDRKATPPSR